MMKNYPFVGYLTIPVFLCGLLTFCTGLSLNDEGAVTTTVIAAKAPVSWPDVNRYDKVISAFESNTSAPLGAVVAYGSSSIGGWHKTIQKDLAPLTIVPRGFGGSNMNDALYYMDRVILPLKPAAILLYEGDNDVASGQSVEAILEKYREFIKGVNFALPQCHIYIISVKPSIARWKMWPTMRLVNDGLKQLTLDDDLKSLTYIDVATPMLDVDGKPRKDIFLSDKLHMNRTGYEIWRDAVRAELMKTGSPVLK